MVIEGGQAVAPAVADRETRARQLLLAHLTAEQADTYLEHGYFVVGFRTAPFQHVFGELSTRARYVVMDFLSKPVARYCFHRGRDSRSSTIHRIFSEECAPRVGHDSINRRTCAVRTS